MQIKKVDNNKLKVILDLTDLDKKDIDVDSFLSNPIETQKLFFEILDIAEEKYNFNIEDNKAIVEAISLDNNIFVLTITKLKNNLENSPYDTSEIYLFENSNNFLEFYIEFLKENKLKNIHIYNFLNKFYLILDNKSTILENSILEYATKIKNSRFLKDILLEYGKKVGIKERIV